MVFACRVITILCLSASLAVFVAACGESASRGYVVEEKGSECGTTRGNFRGQWWNYYERALSYADCEMWPEAEQDLRQALAKRSEDQRRARTRGMHYIDYFPHRELGVALYYQGSLEEAMAELEASLATVKSSKAEDYLDRVRKDWIAQNNLDRLDPSIDIESPRSGARLRDLEITVRGRVRDDTFVKSITVNGIPLRIDLSAPEISFAENIRLSRSDNLIEVVATDLAGRISKSTVAVFSDREGPVVGIWEAIPGGRLQAHVEGAAEVRVNGEIHPVGADGVVSIDQSIPSALVSPHLLIEAVDSVGNQTTAQIDFTDKLNRLDQAPIQLASAGGLASVTGLLGAAATPRGFNLSVNYHEGSAPIFLDAIYLEGRVSMREGVASVRVNGAELINRPGKTVFFTHRLPLAPGLNRIRMNVRDTKGRAVAKEWTLTRALKRLEQPDARYRLALVGLREGDAQGLSPIWEVLGGNGRFQASGIGPLTSTGTAEHALAAGDAADLARADGADGVLLTQVSRDLDSIEYSAQLVDVHSGEAKLLVDAYQEPARDPKALADALIGKLTDALPLLDGAIVTRHDETLGLRFPGAQMLYSDMPLWVYRERPPRTDPRTGALLGSDQEILGEARMLPLDQSEATRARIAGESADIRVGDRVQNR